MSRPENTAAALTWWHTRPHNSDTVAGYLLPFTCFGQFGYGRIDLRVLGQDIYWVDITGAPHLLVDMSPAYRANVMRLIHAQAVQWWGEEVTGRALDAAIQVLKDPDDPATTAALDRLAALLDLEPQEWIDASPLMRCLQQLQTRPAGTA